MNKPKLTKLQKYHLDHVSKSEVSKVIAVTPAATDAEYAMLSAMFMDKLESLAVEAEKSEGGAS